jgi:uncharacterized protein
MASIPAGVFANACIEPRWLKTRSLRIGHGEPTHRIVHFTDLHYRGGRSALESLVSRINAYSPDLVCFTGDLVEDQKHADGALEILAGLTSPLYGVPGNHDYWADFSFDKAAECCASTGGAWLMDQQSVTADGGLVITGASCRTASTPVPAPVPGRKNLLLIHYPTWVNVVTEPFDLCLAGHSHGGQVRLPFIGALVVPFWVDEYDLGLFETSAGPLYVNPGIGWFAVPFRFNCRPEITIIEL